MKVRFAPSPTGFLHIGSARTALFNWIFARHHDASFILRIEDTDASRSRKEYLDEIEESLNWLGISWDECVHQSERFGIYREHAETLISQGKAHREDAAIVFNYEFDTVEFDDAIRGHIIFKELPRQNEVLIKSDGSPTYNFACCVDDALLGITHVIRGEDHIPNTPKQLLLYKALGFKEPCFAHLPMILASAGGKLSKRFGATSLREYRQQGFLPQALANYLLLLGWSPKNNQEIIAWDEAVKIFSLRDVNKTAAAFSLEKLTWMNGEYIKKTPPQDLAPIAQERLKERGIAIPDREYLTRVIELLQSRSGTMSNFATYAEPLLKDDFSYAPDTQEILEKNLTPQITALKERLSKIEKFDKTIIEAEFRATADSLGLKVKELVHPVRVALTGQKVGAGLFETIEVLGKERVLKRLTRLCDEWKKKEAH